MKPYYSTEDYDIFTINPNVGEFNFPYILCIPKNLENKDTLFVESNNEEDPDKLIGSAKGTTLNILNLMSGSRKKSPCFIPVLPTNGLNGRPYFQQLSPECFNGNLPQDKKRIDLQVVKAIEDAKNKIFELTKKNVDEKIFLHGYSSSGVFAQRFTLLHPEIVKEVCIGGAIGSIPMPINEYNGISLDYPAGTNNFSQLCGTEFNAEEYKKINFRYYVAEREADRLSQSRFKEDGTNAPMHDMSYMDRSMPNEVGKNLRDAFGIDMIDRCRNQLHIYKTMGLDISAHEPYPNIMHNEIGTRAFKYIDDCHLESQKQNCMQ